jgi:DNA modification methylase
VPVKTKGSHKRAFPEQMCLDIISCFPESNIILDPFMGSGTTAVAAQTLGKKFIGFDIDEEYCEIAQKRINELK